MVQIPKKLSNFLGLSDEQKARNYISTVDKDLQNIFQSLNQLINDGIVNNNLEIASDGSYRLGNANTDGTWRIVRSTDDLSFQRRESGSFVEKFKILASQPTYTVSNVTTDRTYDANSTSLDEIADVLGTLIADLRATGVLL